MENKNIAVGVFQIMVWQTHRSPRIGIAAIEERLEGFLLIEGRSMLLRRNLRQHLKDNGVRGMYFMTI